MALICMMGLPRSGKSTVAKVISQERNAPIVNRDSIRLALHGERYLKKAEPMVKVIAGIMLTALSTAGHSDIIIDETNLKEDTRRFWRGLAAETAMFAMFLPIETTKEMCLARAVALGDDDLQPVIERMAEYTEPLDSEAGEISMREDFQKNKTIATAIERAETE